ncbi:MAG: hypothetical protein Q7T85_03660 [Nitrosomonas sp.]|nr:hypothetical protein [Nitrosomonas sp.]
MKSLRLFFFLYLLLSSSITWAFGIVRDHVYVNIAAGTSTFTLEFDQIPDFFTLDTFHRQANSFQYFIYGDEFLGYPDYYSSIIRAEELHTTIDTLRIREASPSSGDEGSGGWGAVIAEVPWSLNESTISFTVNTSLLTSFLNEDGVFKYNVEAYEYGGTTSWIHGKYASISPVPLPPAYLLLVTGLFTLLIRNLIHKDNV